MILIHEIHVSEECTEMKFEVRDPHSFLMLLMQ